MASYSIVLAWRIPGTGEPGGLPSMGSHRVTTEATQSQQQNISTNHNHYMYTKNVIHVQVYIHTHISMVTSLSKIFCDFIQVIFLGGLISISPEYFGRSKL